MEALNQSSTFCCNSSDNEADVSFSGMLEVFVHHARNIHNICIYDNQDVYAKFSLTYNPDETISTRVVIGGGKNPDFNEKLELKVNQIDAILKCEIWMLSRARKLLEDQLLGFALVPISDIASQGGKITGQDFSLSSTDLFHSPAGTVQLSVSLSSSKTSSVSDPLISSSNPFPSFSGNSSISSEVVLLDPNEYSSFEFPDINAATEDQMMVSHYFNLNSNSSSIHHAPFLQLGSVSETGDADYEMGGNSSEIENENDNSPNGSNRNSGLVSYTSTSLEDDRNTADSNSIEKKSGVVTVKQSNGDGASSGVIDHGGKSNEIEGSGTNLSSGYGNLGLVFPGRVGNSDLEADQAAMQQQIVDMYMKSMQQFTESLAKMKLPMGLDPNPSNADSGNVIRVMEKSNKLDVESKKDGSRVFYGSRAFF